MRDPQFNLRHLRAFQAVHELGSISAASNRVFLSQPAITQALAKLEAQIGTRLLNRHHAGMTPTEAGAQFGARVTRALAELHHGCDAAVQKARRPTNPGLYPAITSTHLRALTAVARQGSFSVAARSLGLAQPTLYRVARDLEAVAGFALYEKTRTGIALTPAAVILNRAAKLTFAELRHAIDDMAALSGDGPQTLRLGSLPLSRATLLPDAIARLTTDHPRTTVQVVDGPFDDLLHALREGDIDLMIGALRDPVPADDVRQVHLFTDTLGIYCGRNHPLAGRNDLTPADLAAFGWTVPRRGTPTRAAFDRFARALPPQQSLIETSSMSLMRGVLGSTTRLTMISNHQAASDPHLVRLPLPDAALRDEGRPIGITTRASWVPTPAQRHLVRLLHDAAESAAR